MGFKDKKFAKPSRSTANEPTCHLYLGGIGAQMKTPRDALKTLLETFGPLVQEGEDDDGVYLPDDRRFCFASYESIEYASRAFEFFNTTTDFPTLHCTKVDVKYAQRADEIEKGNSDPECTSVSEHIIVPGLAVIPEFISAEEESSLMEELGNDSLPIWKESISRRVQHYGFPFNYRTLMVDYAKPTPPLPPSCRALSDQIAEQYTSCVNSGILPEDSPVFQPLNQLTINEYLPGQGIASHTGIFLFGSKLRFCKDLLLLYRYGCVLWTGLLHSEFRERYCDESD